MLSTYFNRKLVIGVINLKFKGLLRKTGVDKTVLFGFLGQAWVYGSGVITAILIVAYFTPELQGYYYTFGSILQFQFFVEMGLGTVIVQFASHEWSKLNLNKSGQIVGDKDSLSRLISLAGLVLRWYLIAAVIIIFALSLGGYVFFKSSPTSSIPWVFPWVSLSFFTGVSIILVPIWSLLEGCNQVLNLYRFRFYQGVINSLVVWIAICLGTKLWVAAIPGVVMIVCAFIFLKGEYWPFLRTLFLSKACGPRISWRFDILPMQWRIAISWMCGYIIFSLFVPVLFKYHGAVIAGQMGMSWNLLNVIGLAAVCVAPKQPQFGILVAQKKYKELDYLFWKVTKMVITVTFLIAIAICILVWFLNFYGCSIAKRILPLKHMLLFMLPKMIITLSVPFSYYMFAHKKNPLMVLTVINAILTICSTFILGKIYSVIGMGYGFLVIQLSIVPFIFIIWYRCRTVWHGDNLIV